MLPSLSVGRGGHPFPFMSEEEMDIIITLGEKQIRDLLIAHLQAVLGSIEFDASKLTIEVKSKQNYKAEWERADFRAVYKA